jgi:outer membrane protein OmpA-like peptidoglycan-associated protein
MLFNTFIKPLAISYRSKLLIIGIFSCQLAYCQNIIDSCYSFNGKGFNYDFSENSEWGNKNLRGSWEAIVYFKHGRVVKEVNEDSKKTLTRFSKIEKLKCCSNENLVGALEIGFSRPITNFHQWENSKIHKERGLFPHFVAIKLDRQIGEKELIVKIPFTYVSLNSAHSSFAPKIFTNSKPELLTSIFAGQLKGTKLTEDSSYWVNDTLYIKPNPNIRNHNWLIIYAHNEKSTDYAQEGLILAPCCHFCKSKTQDDTITIKNSYQNKYEQILIEKTKLILPNICFKLNDYSLLSEGRIELDSLCSYLLKNSDVKLKIYGYTDDSGSDIANIKLSTNRAKSVYEYLKSKLIVDDRMVFEGKGKENPLFPNDKEENRAKNRRVEITLTK